MENTSQKQIDANRENGKKGGVKTDEGKAVSKYNALKHGILSKQILFEGEDENELLELEKRLVFKQFNNETALALGLLLVDMARERVEEAMSAEPKSAPRSRASPRAPSGPASVRAAVGAPLFCLASPWVEIPLA